MSTTISKPTAQYPVLAPKANRWVSAWLILVCADDACHVHRYTPETGHGSLEPIAIPYSEVWRAIGELAQADVKTWAIGHRVRYLLDRADFIGALERGEIRLQQAKSTLARVKKAKLALSARCLNIDVTVGRKNVKLLDWRNYGLPPIVGTASLTPDLIRRAYGDLDNFLDKLTSAGVCVNKATASQLGWQHMRKHYLPRVLSYNLDDGDRALERRAYYPGRNECYQLGDCPESAILLDRRAAYAATCHDCTLPTYLKERHEGEVDLQQIDIHGDDHWIADVVLSTPASDYPVRVGGDVLYPTGRFQTTLAWPELRNAILHGRVDRILQANRYKSDYVFRRYSQWYLDTRAAIKGGDTPGLEPVIKAIFNGSLGYTARQKYTMLPWDIDIPDRWWIGHTTAPDHSSPCVQARVLDGVREWLSVGGEPREAMPFLHATICSWSRLALSGAMYWAGRPNVYYCDTDSVIVSMAGYANMIDSPGVTGDEPGQFSARTKLGATTINGQKNYRVAGNVVCAGLPKHRREAWTGSYVLQTPTGRTDAEGRVTPFELDCIEDLRTPTGWRNFAR